MARISNSLCSNAQEIVLNSNGGTISIAQDGSDTPVAIQSGIGGSEFSVIAGTDGFNIAANGSSELSVASGALNLFTQGGALSIFTGGGALNLATDTTDTAVTMGTGTGSSAFSLVAGTGGFSIGSQGNSVIQTNGQIINIYSNAGEINLGTDGSDTPVSILNGVGSSPVYITPGTGGLQITSAGSSYITTNNIDLNIETSGGPLNICTQGYDDAITIGNAIGATPFNVFAGTSGISLSSNTGAISLAAAGGNINIAQDNSDTLVNIGTPSGNCGVTLEAGLNGISLYSVGGMFLNNTSGGTTIVDSVFMYLQIGTEAKFSMTSSGGVSTFEIFTTGTDAVVVDIGSANAGSSINLGFGAGGNLNIYNFTTGALVSDSSGNITDANASTAGYVLTSNGSGSVPTFQAPSSGLLWQNNTAPTVSMVVGAGYVDNGTGTPTVYTLPATSVEGDQVAVQGFGAGLWSIVLNTGQTIYTNSGNTTTTTGSISSTGAYNSVTLICTTANTNWVANQENGTLTIV